MKQKRVHVLSTVNAANVSKDGGTYTIRDVCGAVDEIVMHDVLYPGDQLAAGVASLNGRPAPAGHPKDDQGRYISALNGDALLNSYIGAVCRNARHEGGRTLVDIVVNEAQAKAHKDGAKLVERLESAINGSNVDPIHVSTGLVMRPIEVNGESRGKKYRKVATDIRYDHLAILMNQRGAGTPEEGVGMWLNSAGEPEEVEEVALNVEPEDRRHEGLRGWLMKLLGNSELSFDQIQSGLYKGLPENAWLREVFARYAIWSDREGRMYRQDYSVSSDGSVAWSGTAEEVREERKYEPVQNHQENDQVKDKLIAALNAAGIQTDGMSDEKLLAAYNSLVSAPIEAKLTAANAQVAQFEANARAAEEAEAKTLAAELAVNSALTADDLQKLGVARLRELKAAGKGAAPVVAGNSQKKGDEWSAYDLNAFHKEAK